MKEKQRNRRASGYPGKRFKSLFLDWIFISGYLIILLLISLVFYQGVLGTIPEFNQVQSQLVAFFTSVLPITAVFSVMEGRGSYASWGKKKTGLIVTYSGNPVSGSIIRNLLKFLPWQLGHMSTINGIYNGFETPFSIIFFTLSMGLVLVYVLMVLFRTDKRHIADIIAGSTIIEN